MMKQHFANVKFLAFVSALLCMFMLGASIVSAQTTTGTVSGQILDSTGAIVTTAKVTITNDGTGVSQTITTSSAGTFHLPSMLPGIYTLVVEATGFKKFVRKNFVIVANQENVADAKLDVGTLSETVEVSVGSAQVETTSATLNNDFDSKDVLQVPVVGGAAYSALNLSVLAPNTVAQPGGTVGVGGSIGGTRPRDNNFT